MAWSYIGRGTGQAGNNVASLSVPHPGAGETTNNLLVIIAYSRDGSLRTPDLPSGWSPGARSEYRANPRRYPDNCGSTPARYRRSPAGHGDERDQQCRLDPERGFTDLGRD